MVGVGSRAFIYCILFVTSTSAQEDTNSSTSENVISIGAKVTIDPPSATCGSDQVTSVIVTPDGGDTFQEYTCNQTCRTHPQTYTYYEYNEISGSAVGQPGCGPSGYDGGEQTQTSKRRRRASAGSPCYWRAGIYRDPANDISYLIRFTPTSDMNGTLFDDGSISLSVSLTGMKVIIYYVYVSEVADSSLIRSQPSHVLILTHYNKGWKERWTLYLDGEELLSFEYTYGQPTFFPPPNNVDLDDPEPVSIGASLRIETGQCELLHDVQCRPTGISHRILLPNLFGDDDQAAADQRLRLEEGRCSDMEKATFYQCAMLYPACDGNSPNEVQKFPCKAVCEVEKLFQGTVDDFKVYHQSLTRREVVFYSSDDQLDSDFEVLGVASQCLCPPHSPLTYHFIQEGMHSNLCFGYTDDPTEFAFRAGNWPDPQYLTDGVTDPFYIMSPFVLYSQWISQPLSYPILITVELEAFYEIENMRVHSVTALPTYAFFELRGESGSWIPQSLFTFNCSLPDLPEVPGKPCAEIILPLNGSSYTWSSSAGKLLASAARVMIGGPPAGSLPLDETLLSIAAAVGIHTADYHILTEIEVEGQEGECQCYHPDLFDLQCLTVDKKCECIRDSSDQPPGSVCVYSPITVGSPDSTTDVSDVSTSADTTSDDVAGGPSDGNESTLIFTIVAVAAALLLFGIVAVTVVCIRRRQKPIEQLPPETAASPGTGMTLLDLLDRDVRFMLQGVMINRNKLDFQEVIGEGEYGVVYKGALKEKEDQSQDVAIKTLKKGHLRMADIENFLTEATVMRDLVHPNVLGLVGVCVDGRDVFVVLPYMKNGSLKQYLPNPDVDLTMLDLMVFASHIATGMAYLHQQDVLHRDLAARNCMVDDDKVAKVSDFGLARDVYGKEYYRPSQNLSLPIKWMALESLENQGVYTKECDVWSFGVVLWELVTRGKIPYSGIHPLNIKAYLQRGDRLEKPDHCPDAVYRTMVHCWNRDPKERPTFEDLEAYLDIMTNADDPEEEDEEYDNDPEFVAIAMSNEDESPAPQPPEETCEPPVLLSRHQTSSSAADGDVVHPDLPHLNSRRDSYDCISDMYQDPNASMTRTDSYLSPVAFRNSRLSHTVEQPEEQSRI